MTSFICTLSLVVLVLANGYFTAPTTTPLLPHEHGHETTEAPEPVTRSVTDTMEPEVTSPGTEGSTPHGLRLAPIDDEPSTSETVTEEPRSMPEFADIVEYTTQMTINKLKTSGLHPSNSQSNGGESESAEETEKDKPKPGKTHQRRGMLEQSTTTPTTTPAMPSHDSTSSSTIIPGHSTSSTSTQKYTGLLKNDEPEPTEGEHTGKPNKPRPTPEEPMEGEHTGKPNKPRPTPEEPMEGEHTGKPNKPRPTPEEPTPTVGAVIVEPGSIPELNKNMEGYMQYDESTIPSVPESPIITGTTTMEGKTKPEKTQLNEGEKPSQSEEEKSD